jgi:hypothetical protein
MGEVLRDVWDKDLRLRACRTTWENLCYGTSLGYYGASGIYRDEHGQVWSAGQLGGYIISEWCVIYTQTKVYNPHPDPC